MSTGKRIGVHEGGRQSGNGLDAGVVNPPPPKSPPPPPPLSGTQRKQKGKTERLMSAMCQTAFSLPQPPPTLPASAPATVAVHGGEWHKFPFFRRQVRWADFTRGTVTEIFDIRNNVGNGTVKNGPIFLSFFSHSPRIFVPFSSTTSRHNPLQPTSRVLCPPLPHFPPFPPFFQLPKSWFGG